MNYKNSSYRNKTTNELSRYLIKNIKIVKTVFVHLLGKGFTDVRISSRFQLYLFQNHHHLVHVTLGKEEREGGILHLCYMEDCDAWFFAHPPSLFSFLVN